MNKILLKNIDFVKAYLEGTEVQFRDKLNGPWFKVGPLLSAGIGNLFGNPGIEFRLAPTPFRRIVNEYRYDHTEVTKPQFAYYETEEQAKEHRTGPYYYRTFVVEEKIS